MSSRKMESKLTKAIMSMHLSPRLMEMYDVAQAPAMAHHDEFRIGSNTYHSSYGLLRTCGP